VTRSEDDLRAAYQLAAQSPPTVADVLAAPAPAPTWRRPWLAVAAAVAVVLAVGIPVHLVRDHRAPTAASPAAGSHAPAALATTGAAPEAVPGATSAGGAAGRPVATSPVAGAPGVTCGPGDVSLTLSWTRPLLSSTEPGLTGTLAATNISGSPCNLLVKPQLEVTGPDGSPVPNVDSQEQKVGPAQLRPGAVAYSQISWSAWCGVSTSATFTASWGTGDVPVQSTGNGAVVSPCPSGSNGGTISSGWFDPLS
jgi:hypothetical protein